MTGDFSMLPRHEVALVIAGKAYLGWTGISIERAIDAACGSFDLELAAKEKTGAADFAIADGAACQIVLGGSPLITGWVDKVERAISADSRSITVSGRDKACDLVDCSALNSPGSWRNVGLAAIAAALAEPFGMTVKVTGDAGKPLSRFALQQGETAFAAIERLSRYRGLIVFSDGAGGLVIGNPDSKMRAGRLVQGGNVIAASAGRDQSQRYSKYVVKGQSSGSDERHGKTVAQVLGGASDAAVSRYRPLLVIGEEQSDSASLAKRASWEATTRAGRAESASVTVAGWFSGDGSASGPVWQPGARADCDIPACGLSGDRLIERVRFTRNDQDGTRTVLGLVPPSAWAQLAENESSAA